MITFFQIDKSGGDLFEKDYSVVLVVNKKEVYGINVPQKIKDDLTALFKRGSLRIVGSSDRSSEKTQRNRFRIRFHTAIVIQLLKRAIKDLGYVDEVNIEICNDFDGHFHEIKDMIFKHFSKLIPSLKPEDIVSARFQKPSLIDDAGKTFRERDKPKLRDYTTIDLNIDDLYKIIKNDSNRGSKSRTPFAPPCDETPSRYYCLVSK